MPTILNRREWIAGVSASLAVFLGRELPANAQQPESWKNWSGGVHWNPQRVARPKTVAEVVGAVAKSRESGDVLKVAGTGHSFVLLCATDGSFVLLTGLSGVESVDPERQRATVLAGTKLG